MTISPEEQACDVSVVIKFCDLLKLTKVRRQIKCWKAGAGNPMFPSSGGANLHCIAFYSEVGKTETTGCSGMRGVALWFLRFGPVFLNSRLHSWWLA